MWLYLRFKRRRSGKVFAVAVARDESRDEYIENFDVGFLTFDEEDTLGGMLVRTAAFSWVNFLEINGNFYYKFCEGLCNLPNF